MKVVFDTNVLVAAFVTEGLCSKILHRADRKDFQLFISPFILQEFAQALNKRLGLRPKEIEGAKEILLEVVEYIDPEECGIEVPRICRDEDDNRVFACTLVCKALYIVTGDQDLLTLKIFNHFKIITAREFELLFG